MTVRCSIWQCIISIQFAGIEGMSGTRRDRSVYPSDLDRLDHGSRPSTIYSGNSIDNGEGLFSNHRLASTAVVVKKELSQGLWCAQMVHSNVVEMMVSWGRLGCERVERMWSSSDYIVLACQF